MPYETATVTLTDLPADPVEWAAEGAGAHDMMARPEVPAGDPTDQATPAED